MSAITGQRRLLFALLTFLGFLTLIPLSIVVLGMLGIWPGLGGLWGGGMWGAGGASPGWMLGFGVVVPFVLLALALGATYLLYQAVADSG